jgi:mono/diheme cytochrome c family protein
MKWLGISLFATIVLLGCHLSPYSQGARLYATHCGDCHGDEGQGLGALYPPLTDSDFWRDSMSALPCLVKNGRQAPMVVNNQTYTQAMPAIDIDDAAALANLFNFIECQWYHKKRFWTLNTVDSLLASCR